MSTIYLTPPGSGLDQCLHEFKESLRKNPFRTRLIVPSSGLARFITNQLKEEFSAFRKDAVTTPDRFAAELLRQKSPGLILIDEMLARQILYDILQDTDKGSIVARFGISPGKVSDLFLLFQEIRAYQNENTFFSQEKNPKIAELRHLYLQYRSILSQNDFVDGPSLFGRAATIQPDSDLCLFVYGVRSPYPDLQVFFQNLNRNVASFTYYHPYTENRKIFADRAEWLSDSPVPILPDTHYSAFLQLFSGEKSGNHSSREVFIHEFWSQKEEVESIAQEIIRLVDEGVAYSDIAIGTPDLSSVTSLIKDVFPQFGLSFTSSAMIPLSSSPVIQAFVQLLEIPSRGYRREDLVEAYSSPFLGLLEADFPLTPVTVDKIARKALIIDGLSSWTTSLPQLTTRLRDLFSSPETPEYRRREIEREIHQVEMVSAITQPLLHHLQCLESSGTLQKHINNVRGLFSSLKINPSNIVNTVQEGEDLGGFSALLDEMERNSSLYRGREIEYHDFVKILKTELQIRRTQRYHTGRGIRVIGLRELQDQRYPILFLMDLTNKRLPYIPGHLPFLTDSEEMVLNPDMKRMNLRDERFYFISALYASTRSLYVTCTNAPEKDGLIPSPFFREIQQNIPTIEWMPPPPEASKRFRQAYSGRCIGGRILPDPHILPVIGDPKRLTDILSRINMEYFHRSGEYDSPFDGVLCGNEEICACLDDRFGDDHIYSVSVLEEYTGCPFSFYLKHVLGLDALPDVEITLTPADKGTLIHHILAQFYTQWIHERGTPPLAEERDRALYQLRLITEKELADFDKDGPAWDALKSDLLGTGGYHKGVLERFLDVEVARAQSRLCPAFFECSFGFEGVWNSISPEPVTIQVRGEEGASFKIRGFIDRVDVSDDGIFTITDYKTGNHPKLSEIMAGKSLQLPLYLRSFEILTGKKAAAGAYYKLHRREVFHRAELYDPAHHQVREVFSNRSRMGDTCFDEVIEQSIRTAWRSIQSIRCGLFHPPRDSCKSSAYCDFRKICRFSEFRVLELGEPEGGDD